MSLRRSGAHCAAILPSLAKFLRRDIRDVSNVTNFKSFPFCRETKILSVELNIKVHKVYLNSTFDGIKI